MEQVKDTARALVRISFDGSVHKTFRGHMARERFENEDYHQPGDDVRDDWDYSGAIEDGQLYFFLGLKVANAPKKPAWKPGDEFEAVRKAALKEIGEPKE